MYHFIGITDYPMSHLTPEGLRAIIEESEQAADSLPVPQDLTTEGTYDITDERFPDPLIKYTAVLCRRTGQGWASRLR